MDCNEFLRGYSDYDDSLLSPQDMEVFRRHLEACPSCQRYDRVLRKGRMVARQVPGPAPSDEFLPALQHRLRTDGRPRGASRLVGGAHRSGLSPVRSRRVSSPVAAGGFLTLALTAVLAFWLLEPPVGTTVTTLEQLHVHQDAPADLRAVLPTAARAVPHDWTVTRVDHPGGSSYSPLVTGPPAYRSERVAFTSPSSSIRSTLD